MSMRTHRSEIGRHMWQRSDLFWWTLAGGFRGERRAIARGSGL